MALILPLQGIIVINLLRRRGKNICNNFSGVGTTVN